jgi:hypothetical protein
VIVVVGGEGFVGGEDEVAIVEGGGGFLDPKVAIGDLAVAPTGDGGAVGIAVENVAEEESAGGGFTVAFAFLESGLSRMEAAAPGETAATEIHGNGGIFSDPGSGGGVAPIELKSGVAGVPAVGNGKEKRAGRIGDGRGRESCGEKRKEKKEQAGHTA